MDRSVPFVVASIPAVVPVVVAVDPEPRPAAALPSRSRTGSSSVGSSRIASRTSLITPAAFQQETLIGLQNFGNTCYCNAILQALYFCRPLRDRVFAMGDRNISALTGLMQGFKQQQKENVEKLPQQQPLEGTGTKREEEIPPYFKATTMQATVAAESDSDSDKTLLRALKELFVLMHSHRDKKRTGKEAAVAPKEFLQRLRVENDMFEGSHQHDAHELLNFLLNNIADTLVEQQKQLDHLQEFIQQQQQQLSKENIQDAGPIKSPALSGLLQVPASWFGYRSRTPSVQSQTSLAAHPMKRKSSASWIHELLEGGLTSETRCLACQTVTRRLEPFLDLSVDIPHNHCSLTQCLRSFSKPESLSGDNQFHCDHCQGLRDAEKSIKIHKLPRILALHLKRFKYSESVHGLRKLSWRVPFSLELRVPNTTEDCEDPDRLYSLYAIVVHIGGSPSAGHYITLVRSVGRWMVFDDETVYDVEDGELARLFGSGGCVDGVPTPTSSLANHTEYGYGTLQRPGVDFDGMGNPWLAGASHLDSEGMGGALLGAIEGIVPWTTSANRTGTPSASHKLPRVLAGGTAYILFYEAVKEQ